MRFMRNNKRHILNFLFIIIVTLCVSSVFLQNQMYAGHDFKFHLYRLHGIITGLQDGQIYTKIYPYVNNAYGYGTPLFYCDIFLYPFAFLYWLNVPIVLCIKIMVIFYIFLALLFVFIASSKIFKNYKSAPYISTVLYGFCNYYLYDIYVRSAFGEVIALTFSPLVILSMYYIFVEHRNSWALLGFSFAALVLSHNITFFLYCVFFAVTIVVFCIKNRKEKVIIKSILITVVKGVLFAIGLSSFFIFPFLEQMYSDTYIVELYVDSYDLIKSAAGAVDMLAHPFISLDNFYGKDQSCIFNLNFIFYFFQLIYFYLIYKKKGNTWITYLLIFSDISIILSFGLIPFIKTLSFINLIQFSFRFNILAMPMLTFVLTYCVCNLQKTTYLVSIIFIYLYCAVNLLFLNNIITPKYCNDNSSLNDIVSGYREDKVRDYGIIAGSEYLPVMDEKGDFYYSEALLLKTLDENHDYQIIYIEKNGEHIPLPYERNGTYLEFEYNSKGNELLMLPLTHYKGYRAYAIDSNNNKQELKISNPQRWKQVCFNTLKGNYKYVCHYDGSAIQHVSLFISVLTLVFMVLNVIYRKIKVFKLN